jgi:hypothetical protein
MTPGGDSALWKTAVDAKSGRTYYYHVQTRKTQWRKPIELASEEERQVLAEKEKQQRDFFSAMEANILKNLNSPPQTITETKHTAQDETATTTNTEQSTAASSTLPLLPNSKRPTEKLIRTISTMDQTKLYKDVMMMGQSQQRHTHRKQNSSSGDFNNGNNSIPLSLLSIVEGLNDHNDDDDEEEENDAAATIKSQRAVQDFFHSPQEDGNPSNSNERTDESQSSTEDEYDDNTVPFYFTKIAKDDDRRNQLIKQASVAHSADGSLSLGALVAGRETSWGTLSDASNNLSGGVLSLHVDDEEVAALRCVAAAADEMMHLASDEEDDEDTEDESLKGLGINPDYGISNTYPQTHTKATEVLLSRVDSGLTDGGDSIDESGGTNHIANNHKSLTSSVSMPIPKPTRLGQQHRRNTCGTMYVSSTLSDPDKDATITCICAVLRAHILQSVLEDEENISNENDEVPEAHAIFNELAILQKRGSRVEFKSELPSLEPPSLEEVATFYRDVFRKAKLEADCIIMSLIYVERLIKVTNGQLRPRPENWRSILFACMVLSSKVWDDLSMWNADFSQTSPADIRFSLQRINQLEVAVLSCLGYNVKVKAGEYAKYYFLLRSMLIKSGMGGDDLKIMTPLDVQGAKRLQHVSSQFQSTKPRLQQHRSRSLGTIPVESDGSASDARRKAGLEQIVKM